MLELHKALSGGLEAEKAAVAMQSRCGKAKKGRFDHIMTWHDDMCHVVPGVSGDQWL